MNRKLLLDGLTILSRYYDPADNYEAHLDYEEISLPPTNRPLTSDDLSAMIERGWQQYYIGRDYQHPFSADDYRAAQSWTLIG